MNRQVEFTCLICGKKGIDYSGGSKKYCSKACADRARKHTSGIPFGVVGTRSGCDSRCFGCAYGQNGSGSNSKGVDMNYNEFLHTKIEVAPVSGFEVRS